MKCICKHGKTCLACHVDGKCNECTGTLVMVERDWWR